MVLEGIKYELRQTFYEFLTLKADWRRISRRVAPVAAFVTLGAGVLYARKRQNPPDSGFLASCTFTCGSSSSALLKEVRSQAPDFAALQRAARRWRGPMERDLMRVQLGRESTVAVVQRLVAEWQEAGYFAEPLTVKRPREAFPGIDLISQVDESYGRDIGSEVPLCLLEDGHAVRSLSPEDWMAASDSLEVHGAVVLRELISTEQVMRLRERMHLQSSQLDLAKCKGGVPPIREFNSKPLQAEDEDLEPHMSTPGRKHFYLRGRIFEQQVAEAQAGAMPLVWEHLLKQGAPQGLKPYLSEVQLMVSDPCAVDQFWHVDNAASGLTLVVPLTAIPGDMGGTLLLPGSHHLFSNQGTVSRVQNFFSSLLSANGQPSVMLNAGDAFLYDSRLLHRSAANRRYDRTAAVLVFRYDFERPPGMGLIAAQIWSWTGNLLSGLHRFYSRLPPPP
ncbi:Pentatricopeptide repeat-containing protein [Durusdinium trenchii]|uniref:Chloroplastic n=1 Tax=Durusdinium trenchii TaxID=1381693 RepID=A0ABP0M573_9DINO